MSGWLQSPGRRYLAINDGTVANEADGDVLASFSIPAATLTAASTLSLNATLFFTSPLDQPLQCRLQIGPASWRPIFFWTPQSGPAAIGLQITALLFLRGTATHGNLRTVGANAFGSGTDGAADEQLSYNQIVPSSFNPIFMESIFADGAFAIDWNSNVTLRILMQTDGTNLPPGTPLTYVTNNVIIQA